MALPHRVTSCSRQKVIREIFQNTGSQKVVNYVTIKKYMMAYCKDLIYKS